MKQFIVDAFTDKVFHGNQAAVCVLKNWISDELMKNIAVENNFSETAFTVKEADGSYKLRWFTPGGEIDFCGHATLGTAYILFRFYELSAQKITFHTMKGDFFISKDDDFIVMDFPSYNLNKIEVTKEMEDVFKVRPIEAYIDRDLLLVFDDENVVRNMKPDFEKMKNLPGLSFGITAKGKDFDCVSRVFAPKLKVNEDPVTGSTHCMIVPYWSEKLGKSEIHAYQSSERGGVLHCRQNGSRTLIGGKAALFSIAEICGI